MSNQRIGQADPDHYHRLLSEKVEHTNEQFQALFAQSGFDSGLDVFESPSSHFRMRAEFKVWHEGEDSFYVMYAKDEHKTRVKVTDFSIGSKAITQLMPPLMEKIKRHPLLRKKLFQVEFLSTLAGQVLVTLIYHKVLDEHWTQEAQTLEASLNIHIIGRSRKQKITVSQDYVTESLALNSGTFTYQQIESGFTQPNAAICIAMLNWVDDVTRAVGRDLLELYCGNANFTIPLSHNFRKVLATEISKLSTRSALANVQHNHCNNIEIVRLSAEEISEAMEGKRAFRRLKHLDIHAYDFSCVLVDPPRCGLDNGTCTMISRFEHIIYISCNPTTLLANLNQLCATHTIERFALFDQFPYTHHRECGVHLKQKTSP